MNPGIRLSRRLRPALFLASALLALPVAAADRASERAQFRAAYAAAARPPEGAWRKLARTLDPSYPLYPWLEYAALRQGGGALDREEVERYIARWPGTLPASDLREAWLRQAAKKQDWAGFRALYQPGTDRDLQCAALQARLATGGTLAFEADLAGLWEGAQPLPDACAPVLAAARSQGVLDDDQVQARLQRAAEAGKAASAAQAAALLQGSARARAQQLANALRDPAGTLAAARRWPDGEAAREAASFALARRARSDSAAAETAWAALQERFAWEPEQKNRILHAIALYRAASYAPDALARLAALPAGAHDDDTREWHVRVALAGGDFRQALAALDGLSPEQKADARWLYLRARVLSRLGRDAEARPLFAAAAQEANFHGFLAADWIDQPYSICPRSLAAGPADEARLSAQPDLARAFEFHALGMQGPARREWAFALAKLDEGSRNLAADLAYRRGWYDRAIFAFSGDPDGRRLYEQRFPVGMEKQVRRDAKAAGIDPAWAFAIIRAESAWMADARSGPDARGLMQLLPAVGKEVATRARLPWHGAQDLYDPEVNVQLGTLYLGRMADRYEGSPWLASAAYNAGGTPVGRWLKERGTLDPDFFIETIPYRETREYVARVLAFSVIYDWRLNGRVIPLSARMPHIGKAYHAPTAKSPRKAVACASEPATGADAMP